MMMISETEEVVGVEAHFGPTHQDLPKLECNETNSPDDLDDNSYDFDFKDVSVESGKVTGNDSGNGIHVCVGHEGGDRFEEEAENQIGAWRLVAKSDDNSVVEECELLNSFDLESKSIDSKEEKGVVECKSRDTRTEVKLSEGEAVGMEKPQVPSSTLILDSNPPNTKYETDVAELEFESVSLKKSSGGAVDTAQQHGVPINTPDVVVGVVVARESQGVRVKATEEDEVKLLEGIGIAEHEVPSSTSLDLNLEPNPECTKEEVDVVANVTECEMQYTSIKAENEVVVNAEHETLSLELNPVNAKLSGELVKNTEHVILDLQSNPVNAIEEIDVVTDVVEYQGVKAEDEVELSDEVVESADHKTWDLESNPVNAKLSGEVVKNVEHEILDLELNPVNAKLSVEMVRNAEREIDLESNPVNSNGEIDVVADVVELESQDPSMKPVDEVKLSDEVFENAEHETLDLESNPVNTKLSFELVKNAEHEILDLESSPVNANEEIDAVADVAELESQDKSVKAEDEVKLSDEVFENAEHETLDLDSNQVNAKLSVEVVKNEENEILDLESNLVNAKLFSEVVKNAEREVSDLELKPVNANEEIYVVADVERESQDPNVKDEDEVKLSDEVVGNAECENFTKLPSEVVKTVEHETLDLESNPVNGNEEIDVVADVVELESQDPSVKAEDEVKLSGGVENTEHHATLEPEVHVRNISPISSGEYSPDVNKECAANNIELEIEAVEDKVVQIDDENVVLRENGDTGNSRDNNTPVAPPKVEEASAKTQIKSFNFLVKYPRFDDESLREQTRLAKINVDEKTKLRDSIQVQIQEKRASTEIHGTDYEYAKGEIRNVRKMVRLKRIEIDSLQSVINKAKNALSIVDIDSQIYNNAHMIQHETLPLKEKTQLVREIKQLKQHRELLSSNMGSKDEIKQALEQREEVEERLKILRKELVSLKGEVVKAEAAAVEAEKKYDAENIKVKEIQAQFRAADDVHQAAYIQWQSLRKELSKKVDLKSQFPTLEPKQENTAQSVTSDSKSIKKSTEEKNWRVTNKEPAISVPTNGSDTVSGQDIIINELHDDPKKSKEEIEAIKKAEERERKETDAKLKEERRLEALAKASEARERKKRQAEKLQMRLEMKTIKEAEQKEKEREKRLRKKERKKATTTDVNDTNVSEIAPSSESAAETSKDEDVSSVAAPRKPKKHWLFGKQSKAKSTIPPPLCNWNKKKLQQWMCVGITSFVILVLFLLGNMGVFSGVHFKGRSPAM